MRTVVRARIDEKTKEEAAAVLDTIGLTVSDAFRLMMVRIATEKRLPFEPLVPNDETIEAMRAARRGDLVEVGDVETREEGRFAKTLDAQLRGIVADLAADRALAWRHRDHALAGLWKDHRDCHVRPDLVLIHRKPNAAHLDLVRPGSHGEPGL